MNSHQKFFELLKYSNGLKKHIRKNFSLTKLADKFNIPIYSINYINYYQLTRLFLKIN